MKTAKELKQHHTRKLDSGELKPWMEFTEKSFLLFCQQLCKEQREECLLISGYDKSYGIGKQILDAKQPEL